MSSLDSLISPIPSSFLFKLGHHNLVVGYGVLGVNVGGNPHVEGELSSTIPLRPVAFIKDYFNMDSPLLGIYKGFGNIIAGETVSLDKDLLLSLLDFLHDGICATTVRAEIYLGGSIVDGDVSSLGVGATNKQK
jgi:hypothetical protein